MRLEELELTNWTTQEFRLMCKEVNPLSVVLLEDNLEMMIKKRKLLTNTNNLVY